MELLDFVTTYSERGACTCGKCFDAPPNPETHQPEGHTSNVEFFKVKLIHHEGTPIELMKNHLIDIIKSRFPNWLDGQEHSYIEIGGDVGDQGVALQLMGMGELLGVWKLMTPSTIMPFLTDAMKKSMAGGGLVTIRVKE